jgi:hypothetical protein
MAVTLVQTAPTVVGLATVTLPSAPTPGNTLLAWVTNRNDAMGTLPGFTTIATVHNTLGFARGGRMSYRVVQSGDAAGWTSSHTLDRVTLMEWEGEYTGLVSTADDAAASTSMLCGGTVPTSSGDEVVIVGGAAIGNSDGGALSTAITPAAGVTELSEFTNDGGAFTPVHWCGYRQVASGGAAYSAGGTNGVSQAYCGVTVALIGTVAPPPEPPPDYEAPEPGQAIVEIYVDDPDGYRWDVAQWDEATWGEAGWVSITPWVIFADVTWGADRADAGILADQKAGSWVIQTHDPDRVLDPANAESQFYPHLLPDLPIRINHATARTVRTGQVVEVSYSHAERGGRIAASDAVSRAGRAQVPPGTALGDTFIERIEDSIAAAGIQLHVAVRNGWIMDHALAADDPDQTKSVWTRIAEAARELLAVPWVDRDGHIRVTAWDDDTDRGLTIDSSVMVDLAPWVSHDGLYSVVRALDSDGLTIAESRLTPLPAYGERVYDRTEPTIDSESWTARVLADRSGAVLRYRPGTIVPMTAADNNALVDMELMDIVTLDYPEADPPISVRVRVLGARVRVTDRTKQLPAVLTRWEWTLLTTIVPNDPLISDNDASIRYLLSDADGVTFLYPG